MKNKPNYYSIIPAEVRYDNDLTPNAKLLYAEITSLTNKNGTCWSSDQYFMKLYEVQRRTIQNWLKQLEDKGYIVREVKYKAGSKEIEKRFITLVNKNAQGYGKNMHEGMENKCTDNTTRVNTTSKNKEPYSPLKDFDTFWEKYPRKIGKGKAKQSFRKKVKSKEIYEKIIKDLDNRKYDEQWTKDKGKFIPYPATYLNQERWLDEYEINKHKPIQKKKNKVTERKLTNEERQEIISKIEQLKK